MKIGITCYPTYGGSGVVATELGLELAERSHEVHFISYAQPIRLTAPHPNIHYHEVEVSRYPLFDYPPYDLALASRMAEVAELYDLDLLHVHYAIPHSVSALLARQMLAAKPRGRKLPFVTTLHGTDITLVGLDRSYLPITRFSIEDGPDRSRAEWLAVQKGIHNDVIFLGKQEQVQEKLTLADIMLLPSELESFGLAALEAMACEVVPIATNVGGIPEVIEHGKSGYLANVGDVDTMARYAIDLLKDQSRLKEMAKQARAVAKSRFCSSEIIPQYEEFYRRVLARSS